jgi:hypothetical protein
VRAGKAAAQGGDGVASGLFPYIYQGFERAEAALTCRQGDFAEDPSEEGKGAKTSVGT